MDLTYELLKGTAEIQSTFIVANMLGDATPFNSSFLRAIAGQIDVTWAESFHVFRVDDQVKVATIIIRDLMWPCDGFVIIGRQAGNVKPRYLADWTKKDGNEMFAHGDETWKKLWKDVGDVTGTEWEVNAKLETPAGAFAEHPDNRLLTFSVRRK